MKKLFFLTILLFSLFSNCKKEKDISNIYDYEVIVVNPDNNFGFSMHQEGKNTIFTSPYNDIALEVKVNIKDKAITPNEVNVVWTSNLDSVVYQGNLDNNFENKVTVQLSRGIHKLRVDVYPSDNVDQVYTKEIIISNIINLNLLQTSKSMKLNWEKYQGDYFSSYLIYCTSDYGTPIAEITDINITEFEHFDIQLAKEFQYQVVVKNTDPEDINYGSNIMTGTAGEFIVFDGFISKIVTDPNKNYAYGIVNPGLYNTALEYGLVIINLQTMEIEDHILKSIKFGDLDISVDEQSLYACERNDMKIIKLDLNSFIYDVFDSPSYFHKIESGSGLRLFAHRTPPTSGSTSLYILSYGNATYYNTAYSVPSPGPYNLDFSHGDFEYDALNDVLYHAQGNSSEKRIIKMDVSTSTPGYLNNKQASYASSHELIVSKDGQNIFMGDNHFDSNLNEIGNGKYIKACSNDNLLISDANTIYNLSDYSIYMDLPKLGFYGDSNYKFSLNNESLIMCVADEPLSNQYISHIYKVGLD